jgi:hypothetical protein
MQYSGLGPVGSEVVKGWLLLGVGVGWVWLLVGPIMNAQLY